jgi:hypothetical protein
MPCHGPVRVRKYASVSGLLRFALRVKLVEQSFEFRIVQHAGHL